MSTKGCALITGAGARLGKAFAQHLVDQGYSLALHYNSSMQGAEQLAGQYSGVSLHQADFSKADQVKVLIDSVLMHHQRIDLLINNASVFPTDELEDLSSESMLYCYAVNTVSPLLLMQALAATHDCSHIVNILDARVAHAYPQRLVYSLSKRALHDITLHCALRLAPGIRVNAICPGPVLPRSDAGANYGGFQQVINATPLKQQVPVSDLLSALDYLHQHSGITGEVMYVDSGQHLQCR